MKLSIIILNYNVQYFLELCLKSVQEAITSIDAEIIVVDNDSEDDSCKRVKQLFPKVKLIENKENFGFSKGNNIGVAQATGEYICILNPDTVIAEDTFIKLISFAEQKEKLGIVGCKLIDGIGSFLPESKRNIPYVNAAFKKLFGNSNDYYANNLKENEVGKVDVLVGAFMFMKREVYIDINGFDEDYFMYGEDIDISYKALKKGYHNYYFGELSALHFKGESTLRDKNYVSRFYGAMQIFYKKHFRKNVIYDLIVWFGIKFVYLFRTMPTSEIKKVSKYIFISNKINSNLESVLPKKVTLQNELNNIDFNYEVIFDANVLKYKDIISKIENGEKNKSITYKILPNKSNFILGSNDSISMGDIIIFENLI